MIAAHGGDVQEILFYIVCAIRERLTRDQLKQCVARDAYTSLLGGDKKNYSKKLKELYPTAPVVIKDRAFLDYLALPVQRARPLGQFVVVQVPSEMVNYWATDRN